MTLLMKPHFSFSSFGRGIPNLVFAWVRRSSNEIRTILGQMNFFHHYRIIFEVYNDTFEIIPREITLQ